jgi:adenylate cyclase
MTGLQLTTFRVSLLSTLIVVLLYVWTSQTTLLHNLEAKALDLRFQLRGARPPGSPVVLIVIDDRSIAELGRWPWSRSQFAEIAQRLHAAGAKVVAFDLLLAEPETAVEPALLRRLRQTLQSLDSPPQASQLEALAQLLRQIEKASAPDAAFASAIREAGNVVLPFAATLGAPPRHTSQSNRRPQSPEPPIASCRIWTLISRRWRSGVARS